MALLAGSVTVMGPDPLVETGTNLAWALYQAHRATLTLLDPDSPPDGYQGEDWASVARRGRFGQLSYIAKQANAYATGFVNYFTQNATVTVTVSDGGLQTIAGVPTMPGGPPVPAVPTGAPETPVVLVGVFT